MTVIIIVAVVVAYLASTAATRTRTTGTAEPTAGGAWTCSGPARAARTSPSPGRSGPGSATSSDQRDQRRAMLEHVIDKRPQADRLLIGELYGEARRRARWRELGSDEEAAAVTALRELAGGRADLLAEVAGILEGAREGEPDEPLARQAADLCRKAGADPDAIPAWIEEGRRRRAAVRQPPFSGGLHGDGRGRPVS